jgi:hypothetical protein
MQCASGAGNAAGFQTILGTLAVSTTYFLRAYFAPSSALPSAAASVLGCTGTTGVSARLTPGGKLQLWNNEGTPAQIGSDSAATLATLTYYRIELKIVVNGSTQIASGELQLDGVSVATFSGLTLSVASGLSVGWLTAPGANITCRIDDVALNNSAGAVNNSWPGAGKVVLLKATGDSAVGTGWVLGGNGAEAGSGWDNLINTPPQSLADSTGGGTQDSVQIRNATAAANSNFDVTLTTYTAAGVGASDIVNALVPWVCTAATSSTSAKQGTVGIVSNPTIANVALAATGTSGAFWQGNVASTYPAGWKWSPGTITEAPTVTLGTAPVARITQVTSSTRLAMVCFLGMYVDYTPVSGTTYTKAGYGKENA